MCDRLPFSGAWDYYGVMKEIHPSQEDFSDREPERGTPEFEEAKQEAGVGNWFEVFQRNIELAQEKKDRVLLENAVRSMEGDLTDVVAQAMEKGDIVAARTALNELEGFAKEQKLDIKEILESQKERVAKEYLEKLDAMGEEGVADVLRELFHSEGLFDETDVKLILGMTRSLVKEKTYDTLEDAIVEAAKKRWKARPRKHGLFLAVEREGSLVSGAGETPFEAARKRGNE